MRAIDADRLKANFQANTPAAFQGMVPGINYIIDRQETIEPDADRWIPVNEKLPPECEEVNITWVNRDPVSYYANIKGKPFTGSGVYCKGRWYWYSATCADYCKEYGIATNDVMDDEIEVIAWRKFPEPYKEQKEND